MRKQVDSTRLVDFLVALGTAVRVPATVYLVGGSSAVMAGWRSTTRDVDLYVEEDDVLRVIPRLKEELATSVEVASPLDFVPELPGWRERSPYLRTEGLVTVRDFDFYSQALSKLERGFDQDRTDVAAMVERGLVEPRRLRELFAAVEDAFYLFPAVDVAHLRKAVESLASS